MITSDKLSQAAATSLEELIAGWDGEQVVVRYDEPTGTWIFLCMHSTRLGPSGGGTRMKVYGTPAEGLADGMRLAAAMTQKYAITGVPFGGGKAVLAVPELPQGGARRELLLRYGDAIASLRGAFVTGPDVNTSEADMDVVYERAGAAVFCRSVANGGSGSSAPATAVGVFHGIRASAEYALRRGLDSLVVLVQGAGGVGVPLAEHLGAAGAHVLVADIDEGRARETAARCGGEVVPADDAIGVECDVYAPCALGGTLTAETIPRLRCAVVAGAANNQLGAAEDAERLRERGILYAPDFVINAGGVLHGAGLELLGWDGATLQARLAEIADTLLGVYERADRDGASTHEAAARLATERLEAA